MKVTLHTRNPVYPYLAIHKDDLERDDPMIILFTNNNYGVLLAKNKDHPCTIGEIAAWFECSYVPYDEEFTIKNW